MNIVNVVTAYVPLNVKHVSARQYHELGERLVQACEGKIRVFDKFPLEECWLAKDNPPMIPAQPTPADRYATPGDFVRSNIVQHNRTTWANMAAMEDPSVDIWVWMDFGILKQGEFTGKPVKEHHVADLIAALETGPKLAVAPFPGIWPRGPISDTGDNWRFVGSTHIWSRPMIPLLDLLYKGCCRGFIQRTQTVPNDLPIWATVEECWPQLFHFYPANHDATQLTGYPMELL